MNSPKGLSKESATIWKMVFKTCKLMPPEIQLLVVACQSWDEMQKARKILNDRGFLIKDKKVGIRCNPAAQILKDSRGAFLRSWKALGFKDENDFKKAGRPPVKREFEFDED